MDLRVEMALHPAAAFAKPKELAKMNPGRSLSDSAICAVSFCIVMADASFRHTLLNRAKQIGFPAW